MQNGKNKQLPPAQIASLELLECFANICEKYNFKYVLGKETAMGIQIKKGFMPWVASLTIILLYYQLEEFIKVCEIELKGTPYYLITHDNTEQFDDFFIRMAKRSKVKLGVGREKDEKYYDYYIDIIPAFYTGNSIKESKRIERAYEKYKKLLNSRCLVPEMLKTGKRIIKQIKSACYYHKKRPDDYKRTLKILNMYNHPTKYLYIPSDKKTKGSIIGANQITERRLYDFEGKQYYSFLDLEKYLVDLYGKKYEKKHAEEQINQAVLEGPEILRRVQLIELDMLIEFDKICRRHGIKYTLGAGTLLGAIRHKGFIPWDDDIDVFMLYDEYKKFISIAKVELDQEKYFLRTQDSDVDCNLVFTTIKRNGTKYIKGGREKYNTHPGVPIDVFPLFNAPSTRIGHWLQDKVCKFFKTMTWAHMGADSERNIIKRQYYRLLAQVSNKRSYDLFMKYATRVKKPSKRVTFFDIKRNFINNPVTKRELYEKLIEIEFEGYMFYLTRYWADYLEYTFSKDYTRYPSMADRTPKHMPAIVEICDLFNNL